MKIVRRSLKNEVSAVADQTTSAKLTECCKREGQKQTFRFLQFHGVRCQAAITVLLRCVQLLVVDVVIHPADWMNVDGRRFAHVVVSLCPAVEMDEEISVFKDVICSRDSVLQHNPQPKPTELCSSKKDLALSLDCSTEFQRLRSLLLQHIPTVATQTRLGVLLSQASTFIPFIHSVGSELRS